MPVARDDLRAFLQADGGCMLVEVAAVDGSTPREAGAWMLVSATATFATIGGGQLEFMAIDHARRALRQGQPAAPLTIPLGPEIGQCCGGRVQLVFATVTPALAARLLERRDREIATRPSVHLFGAGHVGNALALALSLAPVRTILVDGRADAYPAALSGGQQQRCAIARALAMDPEVILFDEPTSALDPELVGEVLAVIRDLAAEKRTMVIVTHQMDFARDVADHTIFMDGGVIVEQGPSGPLLAAPREERTRRFLARSGVLQ